MATLVSQNGLLSDAAIVNVASVRQISPFRYPGGKTWLVPTVMQWLRSRAPECTTIVDPFTGGGSVPLGMIAEGVVGRAVLGDLDEDVSAVWRCVLGSRSMALCDRIANFRISRDAVIRELETPSTDIVDRAFQTLLKNRTYRGGILAQGASLMKVGENGRGVASRWYPETLIKRLRILSLLSPQIEFFEGDAFALIDQFERRPDVFFFVDPPYTAGAGKRAGTRLYRHSTLDHRLLFARMSKVCGKVLMTYDECDEVIEMAESYGFSIERVAMKNTHHVRKNELLISNFTFAQ